MKILYILPVLGQPRYSKRIDMLKEAGSSPTVAAFERDYHKGRLPSIEIKRLGFIESGRYFKRLKIYLLSLRKIRYLAKKNNVVYSFGFDVFLLSYFATVGLSCKRVLEVADIRKLQTGDSFKAKLFRFVERVFSSKIDLLIVTSEKYYTEYYCKWLNVSLNYLVVENKLEPSCLDSRPKTAVESADFIKKVSVGYFGLLRCAWSAKVLYTLAKKYPNKFKIILAGHWFLEKEMLEMLVELDNVIFLGEYKSPDDLNKIYSQVDIVWSCYSPFEKNNYNSYWAKTNRFYESLFYSKPMVVTKNSADEASVLKYNIGLSIDGKFEEAADYVCSHVCPETINAWSINMRNVPSKLFLYTNEADNIISNINIT